MGSYLRQVEILAPQINQDAHTIKSLIISQKSRSSDNVLKRVFAVVVVSGLMERSDVQRDPDVQMLSVLGVAYACLHKHCSNFTTCQPTAEHSKHT